MEDTSLINPGSRNSASAKKILIALAVITLIVVVVVVVTLSVLLTRRNEPLEICNFTTPLPSPTYENHTAILIRDAVIWVGDGEVLSHFDLLIENGRISSIAQNISPLPPEIHIVEANATIITPGLVDMHSHIGTHAWPSSWADTDNNDMTNPALPQLRVRDGIHEDDVAYRYVAEGGITSALVLPGSGNVMGGQAAMIKLKQGPLNDMFVIDGPHALKFACGENPKRNYGRRNVLPGSRMGIAWVMRDKFSKTKKVKEEQDEFCGKKSQNEKDFPSDLALENLVRLFRNSSLLNIHCYKVVDIEMAVRVANEFSVQIAAFHHALEAYKVPTLLRNHNISVALFIDHWGFKMEAYEASVWGPYILDQAGVNTCLKTDHPVLNAREFIYEAQKAFHYGMEEQRAFATVTSNPARAIQMDYRVGRLDEGMDADIIIWDRNPLSLGATPIQIYIEGKLEVSRDIPIRFDRMYVTPPESKMEVMNGVCEVEAMTFPSYAIANATIFTMSAQPQPEIPSNGVVLILNGIISCIGNAATCTIPSNATIFDMKGGVVIPGLIGTGSNLGLVEMPSETTGQDGSAEGSISDMTKIQANDGIRFSGKKIYAAWAGGIMVGISAPQGSSLVLGQSAAFETFPHQFYSQSAEVSSSASLSVQVGDQVKRDSTPIGSISSQFASLKSYMASVASNATNDPIFESVLSGTLPLRAFANQAEHISSFLRLKATYPNLNLIIEGGSEAYLLASELAAAGVSVVLTDETTSRCTPSAIYTRCDISKSHLLADAGVMVGLGLEDGAMIRNMRWEAGLAIEKMGFDYTTALASITSNLADIYQLPNGVGRIVVGTKARIVGYSGDALYLESVMEFIANGESVSCGARQE